MKAGVGEHPHQARMASARLRQSVHLSVRQVAVLPIANASTPPSAPIVAT
jgi:hypothetical protein